MISSKFLVLTFYRTFYFGEILVFLFLTLIFVFFYHSLSSDCSGFSQLIKQLYQSNSLDLVFQSLVKIVSVISFLIINFIFNIFNNLFSFSNEINMLSTSFAVPRKKRRVRARVVSKGRTAKVYMFKFLYLIKRN